MALVAPRRRASPDRATIGKPRPSRSRNAATSPRRHRPRPRRSSKSGPASAVIQALHRGHLVLARPAPGRPEVQRARRGRAATRARSGGRRRAAAARSRAPAGRADRISGGGASTARRTRPPRSRVQRDREAPRHVGRRRSAGGGLLRGRAGSARASRPSRLPPSGRLRRLLGLRASAGSASRLAVDQLDHRHRRGVAEPRARASGRACSRPAARGSARRARRRASPRPRGCAPRRSAWRRACRSPRLPSVIMRSATRRSSFALASVVSIRSCSSSDVTMLRNSAFRCALVRPSFRLPCGVASSQASRCSRSFSRSLRGGKFSSFMPSESPIDCEHLLDLVQRLAAEVLRLEHLGLGLLHQLADVADVRVLEAVGRAHRELELVDRAEEVRVERLRLVERGVAVSVGSSKLMKIVSWSFRIFAA